jgi:competence protein ComEC
VDRPAIAAGAAFVLGALTGSVALVPAALFAAAALATKRGMGPALALFAVAGVCARATAPRASPILERGTWILEGTLLEHDGDRARIDLIGAAPIGDSLEPRTGRLPAIGSFEHCRTGDRARFLARTKTIAPFGFPGERAEPRHTLANVQRCVAIDASTDWIGIDRLRERMRREIDRALPPERAAVVRAMALGDRIPRSLGPERARELRRDFADSGLAHVLAVSGQHLSIVAALFTVLLAAAFGRISAIRDRWGTRRPTALAAIALVVLYTLLVGAPPSAVRAAVMVILLLAGDLISRRREAWSALAIAAVGMIALDPSVIDSLSFLLSFAAVLGLLALDRAAKVHLALARWPRPLRAIGSVVVSSWAATIGTAPILAHHFGRISLIGLVANVPAAPLVGLFLLPLSLAGGLAAAISPAIGAPILRAAGLGAEVLIGLARFAAEVPGATIAVSLLETMLAAAALLAWILFGRRKLALVSIGALAIAATIERWPDLPDRLVLTALPVGQGTAVLLETPTGQRILVDTGPPDTADRVLIPYLIHRRIDHLDLVVLSHPHADHVGGFDLLSRRVEIDRVWTNRTVTATTARFGAATVEVLQALPDAPNLNDGSIVLRVRYGDVRILLPGDAERAAEASLLESGRDLGADVLIVGHHGSATSSSDAFLDAVDPSIAIIPVGRDNGFHHPNPRVVARLERRQIRVFRTDRDGAIEVRTDGSVYAGAATASERF